MKRKSSLNIKNHIEFMDPDQQDNSNHIPYIHYGGFAGGLFHAGVTG